MGVIHLEEDLHTSEYYLNASLEARGLWLTCMSWAAKNRTKGFVPMSVARLYAGERWEYMHDDLLSDGLWYQAPGGFTLCDFNPAIFSAPVVGDGQYRQYKAAVFLRDCYRCVYCGATENLTLDHIIPQSQGGAHDPDNLCACCRSCNSSKGARTPEEWRAALCPG